MDFSKENDQNIYTIFAHPKYIETFQKPVPLIETDYQPKKLSNIRDYSSNIKNKEFKELYNSFRDIT